MNKKRYVITGGAGFIGFNFIKMLFAQDSSASVVNVDLLTYAANKKHLHEFEKFSNYCFAETDICNAAVMREIIKADDIVVNFAAESHVDRSIKDANIFLQTNILGVDNLLKICAEKKAKVYVQISTDEVYGELDFADSPSNERDTLRPSSPYSASKAAAEMLCFSAYKTFGLPILITRSSNNYGPFQFPEKIIPLFVTKLLNNEKVPLYGSGQNVRDWIYVEDNCRGILKVIERGLPGNVYNIGGNNQLSNKDLTSMLLQLLGKDATYVDYVQDRLGHDLRYALDTEKITGLGWRAKVSFIDGLKKTVDWYKLQQ